MSVYCANVGDSRCVFADKSDGVLKVQELSYDQKPNIEEEKERIENAGGFVHHNRVDGNLNLSRALGDHELKDNPDLPLDQQKVIPVPVIQTAKA